VVLYSTQNKFIVELLIYEINKTASRYNGHSGPKYFARNSYFPLPVIATQAIKKGPTHINLLGIISLSGKPWIHPSKNLSCRPQIGTQASASIRLV